MNRLVVVHPDAEVLAHAVAARLLTQIIDVQSVKRPVHVGLTGGTIGIALLEQAAECSLLGAIDWSGVHLWWGDERFLPPSDPDRNETQARAALLDQLVEGWGLPEENIHPAPYIEGGLDAAAAAYGAEMATALPDGLDILLLGMGPDGHTASLFPGHPALTATGANVVPVRHSPKPPPERVSMTFEAINSAREVWVVVAGADKAENTAAALAGLPVEEVPAAGVHGVERTLWLLDTAAADAP